MPFVPLRTQSTQSQSQVHAIKESRLTLQPVPYAVRPSMRARLPSISHLCNALPFPHHNNNHTSLRPLLCPLQVIIMQTPVGRFFKVHPINGVEWAISVAIGISAIPVSVLTRLLTRACKCLPSPTDLRGKRRRARKTNSGAQPPCRCCHCVCVVSQVPRLLYSKAHVGCDMTHGVAPAASPSSVAVIALQVTCSCW